MELFSAKERATIEAAITKAERKTSGEIVVVAATASAGYFAYAIMWAALLALLVPWPLIYLTNWPVEHIYLAQLGVFIIGAALTQWEDLRFAIVPKSVKRARAHQKAVEQFLAQSLHTTKGRTGVMIYVSFAERYAEVIADEGIYEQSAAGDVERGGRYAHRASCARCARRGVRHRDRHLRRDSRRTFPAGQLRPR